MKKQGQVRAALKAEKLNLFAQPAKGLPAFHSAHPVRRRAGSGELPCGSGMHRGAGAAANGAL